MCHAGPGDPSGASLGALVHDAVLTYTILGAPELKYGIIYPRIIISIVYSAPELL